MVSISIIGIGRAGGSLAYALRDKAALRALVYRTDRPLFDGFPSELLRPTIEIDGIDSDVLIIATGDPDIRATASQVAEFDTLPRVALHLSGSRSSAELAPLSERGVSIGSMHPLISLSDAKLGSQRLDGAYFCIEGDDEATAAAREIAELIGGRPFTIDTQFKTLYHAAAVMASGHITALLDAAVEVMTRCGLETERAKEVLMPLVASTVANLKELPAEAALTGPYARGDASTFERHISDLATAVPISINEIYLDLAARSVEIAGRRDGAPEQLEVLARAISVAKDKLG